MKEFIERWRTESPIFFKKIRTISLAIATASTGVAIFYTQLSPSLQTYIPVNLLKYFIVAGAVAAFVANLTKVDPTNTTTK